MKNLGQRLEWLLVTHSKNKSLIWRILKDLKGENLKLSNFSPTRIEKNPNSGAGESFLIRGFRKEDSRVVKVTFRVDEVAGGYILSEETNRAYKEK